MEINGVEELHNLLSGALSMVPVHKNSTGKGFVST